MTFLNNFKRNAQVLVMKKKDLKFLKNAKNQLFYRKSDFSHILSHGSTSNLLEKINRVKYQHKIGPHEVEVWLV